MRFEVVLVLVVVVIASASAQLKKLLRQDDLEEYIDYRAPPRYKYDYAVYDPLTKDIKSQWEERDDKVTKGVYTLLQPDGRRRIVEYTAGKNGVEYNVRYEGRATYGGIGGLGLGGYKR